MDAWPPFQRLTKRRAAPAPALFSSAGFLTGARKKCLPSGKQGQELKQKQEATGLSTTLTESNGRLGDSVKDYFLYFSVGFSIGGVMLPRESRRNRNGREAKGGGRDPD